MVIQKKIETAIVFLNFVFLIASLLVKDKQTEYSPYSKFLFHTYMIGLIGLCLMSSLCKANFITKQIGILTSGKGKGILLLFVGLVYITKTAMIPFVVGIIITCSAVALIILDKYLPCEANSSDEKTKTNSIKGTETPLGTITLGENNKDTNNNNPYGVPEDF